MQTKVTFPETKHHEDRVINSLQEDWWNIAICSLFFFFLWSHSKWVQLT